ncbi:uncharacterized protein LOC125521344 isoform X2 [Triticum urartu]|uniref:uncharacterized protein LOC125521344 isoform X2 n=1 Tax=Triticum urartu TaxID=4572 RepID=UPI0020443E76|nr:uncharacterized protein LOC125521344 isoform X2 [Triticum urartu]
MEAMRAGRGRGGRAAGHEGHGGCGRKQHGLKERRMWEGSEVGEDSSAGRQQAPVLRSVAYLFFSLRLAALFPRRGEAANDREKEQVVEECKQKVSGDWKSETDDRAYCFGYEWLEILWLDVPGAVRPFQDRSSDGEHIRRQHTKKQEQNESEHHRKDDYKQATRTSQWAWHFQATRTSQRAWHFMQNEQRDQAWDWCLVAAVIPSGISIPVTTSSREDVCFLQRV